MVENAFIIPPEWLKLLLDNLYLILFIFYKKIARGSSLLLGYAKDISNHLAKIDISLAKLTTLTEQHDKRITTLERSK